MPTFATLLPRFPIGSLIISHCVDTLIRQDLLDVRRHICGDWGDMRAEHRRLPAVLQKKDAEASIP